MNLISKTRPEVAEDVSGAPTAAEIGSPSPAADPGWRNALIGLAIAIPALFALFWDAASHAVFVWYGSATFNHGFLILPICGYLIWIRRQELMAVAPRSNFLGLAGLCVLGFGWLLGNVAEVMLVQQVALIGMVQLVVFTVLGGRATALIAFPLFYLFFAVPFGEFMVPPLQDLTAAFVVWVLRLIDIPVFIDGIFISIPTGNFKVAEACAGVRFLIATVALGFLFAYLNYRTFWRRALFILLAFVVPIAANGVRAFGIVYIAYKTNNEYAAGVDHLVYGWVFFAIVTVLLLLLGMSFREKAGADDATGAGSVSRKPGAAEPRRRLIVTLASAMLVAAAAPAYAALIEGPANIRMTGRLAPPDARGGWRMLPGYADTWRPDFPGADARVSASYSRGRDTVHVFIAYYTHQRQGAELVSSDNSIIGRRDWSRAESGRNYATVEDRTLAILSTRAVRRDRGRLIWHWYWVGGAYTADKIVVKLLQAKLKLLGEPPAGAAIAIAADYQERPIEAEETLRAFLRDTAPFSALLSRIADR